MQILEKCREKCYQAPKKIVFPDTNDVRLLHAANELKLKGLAEPILLGNPFMLRDKAYKAGIAIPCLTIFTPENAECFERMIEVFISKQRKSITYEEARRQVSEPLQFSALMVDQGYADLCIAGNLATTSNVIRSAIRGIGVAPTRKTVSSFFLMLAPNDSKVYAFADAGVIPEPTTEQLVDIAIDTANNFQKLTGEQARVAMLSFSTKGSASHPSVNKISDATELIRQQCPGLIIDGEVQFDAAIEPTIATQKMPNSPLGGKANVFIFPSLSAGNIAYKVAQLLGGYVALGPILQGLNKPMHDLSRGCSSDDIIDISVIASCI